MGFASPIWEIQSMFPTLQLISHTFSLMQCEAWPCNQHKNGISDKILAMVLSSNNKRFGAKYHEQILRVAQNMKKHSQKGSKIPYNGPEEKTKWQIFCLVTVRVIETLFIPSWFQKYQKSPPARETPCENILKGDNHLKITRKICKISRENIKQFSRNRRRCSKIGQNDLQQETNWKKNLLW